MVELDADQPPPTLYTLMLSAKTWLGGQRDLDIHALVTGGPVYAADVPVAGVVFGRAVKRQCATLLLRN